jgi:hypothetical protein
VIAVRSYNGVVCKLCGRSFPVSAKVLHLKNQIEHGAENVVHAFAARCKRCKCESIYEISDVGTFNEEPPKRAPKARGAAG